MHKQPMIIVTTIKIIIHDPRWTPQRRWPQTKLKQIW